MNPIKTLLTAPLFILSGAVLAESASYEDLPLNVISTGVFGVDQGWSFDVGIEAAYEAEFHGSKDYSTELMPDVSISYRDGDIRYFTELTDWGVQYQVSDRAFVGAALSYEMGREEADHKALTGLGDIDSSIELYVDGMYVLNDNWSLLARYLRDVGGAGKGNVAFLGANYRIDTGSPNFVVDISSDVSFADSKHMNTEFGVNATQSLNSGYDEYSAGAGIKSYGLGINTAYKLNENMALTFETSYEKYASKASNSPLLKLNGQDYEVEAEVGFNYSF